MILIKQNLSDMGNRIILGKKVRKIFNQLFDSYNLKVYNCNIDQE